VLARHALRRRRRELGRDLLAGHRRVARRSPPGWFIASIIAA
jgi:hypothetical protein